jgi:hypothetical protein
LKDAGLRSYEKPKNYCREPNEVTALSPERANSGKVAAFVGEKAQHRNRVDALHDLFVGERHG